eukprot:ANDGO_02949.mRNA.1 hypothetical protein
MADARHRPAKRIRFSESQGPDINHAVPVSQEAGGSSSQSDPLFHPPGENGENGENGDARDNDDDGDAVESLAVRDGPSQTSVHEQQESDAPTTETDAASRLDAVNVAFSSVQLLSTEFKKTGLGYLSLRPEFGVLKWPLGKELLDSFDDEFRNAYADESDLDADCVRLAVDPSDERPSRSLGWSHPEGRIYPEEWSDRNRHETMDMLHEVLRFANALKLHALEHRPSRRKEPSAHAPQLRSTNPLAPFGLMGEYPSRAVTAGDSPILFAADDSSIADAEDAEQAPLGRDDDSSEYADSDDSDIALGDLSAASQFSFSGLFSSDADDSQGRFSLLQMNPAAEPSSPDVLLSLIQSPSSSPLARRPVSAAAAAGDSNNLSRKIHGLSREATTALRDSSLMFLAAEAAEVPREVLNRAKERVRKAMAAQEVADSSSSSSSGVANARSSNPNPVLDCIYGRVASRSILELSGFRRRSMKIPRAARGPSGVAGASTHDPT